MTGTGNEEGAVMHLPPARFSIVPRAWSLRRDDDTIVAVIELGDAVVVHVRSAEWGRQAAAAFTRAAELIDAAPGGAS